MVKLLNNPVKASDISRLDENSLSLGVPKSFLMECAGLQATNKICEKYSLNEDSKIYIFCGTGNNGGDGFVIARHLASRGINVQVILLGQPSHIRTNEARLNYKIIKNLPLNINILIIKDSKKLKKILPKMADATLVLDALLGTGVEGELREPIASAVDVINESNCPIVAIDVATGVNPDTGKKTNKSVNCNFRISFHRDKIGLKNEKEGITNWIAPIGTPIEAHLFVGDGDLLKSIKKREITNHKGNYGKMLVIGGSSTYSGAPAMAAMAGIELGLDLVIVLAPKGSGNVIKSYSPNLIVREGSKGNFCLADFEIAKKLTIWCDSVLIGPGIGLNSETIDFLRKYLNWLLEIDKPFVVDADGIKILGKLLRNKQIILKDDLLYKRFCVTPHIGELAEIIDVSLIPKYDNFIKRGTFLKKRLSKFNAVFLVKGVNDYIITNYSGTKFGFKINRTGCAEMTVGGTGDILAGIVAGLMSLGNDAFESACSAAYLNGKLGENAKRDHGSRIQATDLLKNIRNYLKKKICNSLQFNG